jgi:heterotetrameric sarcosine oxidase delta subunit
MLLIPCPWCGPRHEKEFSYGGEANIARPKNSQALSDEEWGDYLYMRANTRGPYVEQWCHSAGCRRWFNITRDTVNNHFIEVRGMKEPMTHGKTDAE